MLISLFPPEEEYQLQNWYSVPQISAFRREVTPMQQPQVSPFKRFHLLAYTIFWGGEFLIMFLAYLVKQVFNITPHGMDLLMIGPAWVLMFVGAVLLLIGNFHLHFIGNRVTDLILGLVSAIIQAGANFVAWFVIWFIFLTEVLGINIC
ncbi:MAG: hypothetical protein CME32_00230 [Gimesia sp.]|nr:hypothetical protein [Gimesia sp.]